jgi:hypothetical protein
MPRPNRTGIVGGGGRDPNRFPVPVTGILTLSASAATQITVPSGGPLTVLVSADGGRVTATAASG